MCNFNALSCLNTAGTGVYCVQFQCLVMRVLTLQSRLQCRLRAGLTVCLYDKALVAQHGNGPGLSGSPSSKQHQARQQQQQQAGSPTPELSTLVGVDTGQATNILISALELCSLPLQIMLALFLLYMQVREGRQYWWLSAVTVSLNLLCQLPKCALNPLPVLKFIL